MKRPADVDTALRDLAAHLAAPAEPDLAAAVGAAVRAGHHPPEAGPIVAPVAPSVWTRSRRILVAGLVAVLVGGVVLGLSPSARHAVARWLGLHDVRITRQQAPPTLPPGGGLRLGAPVGLTEAGRRVGFPLLVPGALGTPEGVYVGTPPAGGQVALVYRQGGLLVTEFRGGLERELFLKVVGPDTTIHEVTVSGRTGYWLEGAPHAFVYRGADGNIRSEDVRLAGNVLLWDRDVGGVRVVLRVEGAASQEEALAIAASVR